MDIERDVYKDFLDWKDNSDLVLLVEGARQVGKTYLATKFANENFKNVIYINIADDTGKVFIDILNKYINTTKNNITPITIPNTILIEI